LKDLKLLDFSALFCFTGMLTLRIAALLPSFMICIEKNKATNYHVRPRNAPNILPRCVCPLNSLNPFLLSAVAHFYRSWVSESITDELFWFQADDSVSTYLLTVILTLVDSTLARFSKSSGTLKAKLAKLRSELFLEQSGGGGGGGGVGDGFAVARNGDARVALIGFPSVGKSSLLNQLTTTESAAANYEFTTLTCIPGVVRYKGSKIQLLDLPGIIEGAAHGAGRGKEVIAVARSADAILIVLDAGKEGLQKHREILERELETVGIRLNQKPPDVTFTTRKMGGGVRFASTVPQPQLGPEPEKLVTQILREYKINSADLLAREEITVDQLVDVVQGNRQYKPCLYLYNKIDTVTIEEVDQLARMPHSMVGSVAMSFNISSDPLEDDLVKQKMWEYLELTRIYTKRKGTPSLRSNNFAIKARLAPYCFSFSSQHLHQTLKNQWY
jgi:small GTP-binding protein